MAARTLRYDKGRPPGERPRAVTWGAAVVAAALALIGCAGGARAPAQSLAEKAPASAPPHATPGPGDVLRAINGDFHKEYKAGRAKDEETIGASRPYFAVRDGKLVLHYGGKTEERSLESARFDAVKAASHVVVTALSAILANDDAKALRELADRIRGADSSITPALFGDAEAAAHAVVRASVELLEGALAKPPAEADLQAFGRRTRADTTRLLQAGCDESLIRLDAAVRELRPLVGDAWWRSVVTIATDHQSRAEEVSVQYFEHLFHERATEGALGEARIVVIESIGPNDGVTQAMASHLYDQRLSVLLFDDPTFLQGDVLGKHAEPTITRLLATPF